MEAENILVIEPARAANVRLDFRCRPNLLLWRRYKWRFIRFQITGIYPRRRRTWTFGKMRRNPHEVRRWWHVRPPPTAVVGCTRKTDHVFSPRKSYIEEAFLFGLSRH